MFWHKCEQPKCATCKEKGIGESINQLFGFVKCTECIVISKCLLSEISWSLSEQTQHLELYVFIYNLRHVSAVCFGHHLVESQYKWKSKGSSEYFSIYVTVIVPDDGRNMTGIVNECIAFKVLCLL